MILLIIEIWVDCSGDSGFKGSLRKVYFFLGRGLGLVNFFGDEYYFINMNILLKKFKRICNSIVIYVFKI